MWLFTAVESNMCSSNVLKTPDSTQTCSTVLAIALDSPVLCGKSPPFTLSILLIHFSVSSQILISPSDGSLRPPFVFHVTNKSGMLSLVVVRAVIHCIQWIFFSTILTTYPAIYDIAASLYSDSSIALETSQ